MCKRTRLLVDNIVNNIKKEIKRVKEEEYMDEIGVYAKKYE